MSTPAAAHLLLWQALERQADWISDYISIHSVLKEYLEWFFERLKDRVAQESSEQDLDHLVRAEVKSIYGEFPGSPSGSPYAGDYADAEAHKVETSSFVLSTDAAGMRNVMDLLSAVVLVRATQCRLLSIRRVQTATRRLSRRTQPYDNDVNGLKLAANVSLTTSAA